MKVLAMIFAAVCMLADAYTTHRSLQLGNREAHPVLRWLLGEKPRLGAAIAWRALVFAALALWVPMPWWGWGMFGALFAWAACRNAALLEVG